MFSIYTWTWYYPISNRFQDGAGKRFFVSSIYLCISLSPLPQMFCTSTRRFTSCQLRRYISLWFDDQLFHIFQFHKAKGCYGMKDLFKIQAFNNLEKCIFQNLNMTRKYMLWGSVLLNSRSFSVIKPKYLIAM